MAWRLEKSGTTRFDASMECGTNGRNTMLDELHPTLVEHQLLAMTIKCRICGAEPGELCTPQSPEDEEWQAMTRCRYHYDRYGDATPPYKE